MTNELIEKAKECKSAEELLALAKENNIEMTAEEAAEKYAELHTEGELSDDELDSAAGGGCHRPDGRLVITLNHSCDHYTCKKCGKGKGANFTVHHAKNCTIYTNGVCSDCKFMSYEKGLWICNNEENMK